MRAPAKERISVRELASEILTENLSGGLDAIGQHAQGMYGGLPQGMGLGGPHSGSSAIFQSMQQQMVDRFQRVVPAWPIRQRDYVADPGEVRANIQFANEVGDLWCRPFGEPPELVLVDDAPA